MHRERVGQHLLRRSVVPVAHHLDHLELIAGLHHLPEREVPIQRWRRPASKRTPSCPQLKSASMRRPQCRWRAGHANGNPPSPARRRMSRRCQRATCTPRSSRFRWKVTGPSYFCDEDFSVSAHFSASGRRASREAARRCRGLDRHRAAVGRRSICGALCAEVDCLVSARGGSRCCAGLAR